MSPNDSDSSDHEAEEYTETNVLLGYASKEPTDDTISHLGGQPTWLDPAHAPSAAFAQCKVCHDMMRLLLQLNGDLPERFPGHERRLHIFACPRRTCNRKDGSIRALKGTRVDGKTAVKRADRTDNHQVEQQQGKVEKRDTSSRRRDVGADLFGGGGKPPSSTMASKTNPFATSTSSENASNLNPFGPALSNPSTLAAKPAQNPSPSSSDDLPTSFASALSLNQQQPPPPKTTPPQKHIPWPSSDSLPTPYPKYFLDAEYETLDPQQPSVASTQAQPMKDYEEEPSNSANSREPSTYESTHDKTFQTFADRLAQNPLQVLRYEFAGTPLLYSRSDGVGRRFSPSSSQNNHEQQQLSSAGMPRCSNCGARRVFELQLTPHAITALEADEEEDLALEGMEWGTVLLGVCERDCVPSLGCEGREGDEVGMEVGYVEEWVGVQWEERRKGGG